MNKDLKITLLIFAGTFLAGLALLALLWLEQESREAAEFVQWLRSQR